MPDLNIQINRLKSEITKKESVLKSLQFERIKLCDHRMIKTERYSSETYQCIECGLKHKTSGCGKLNTPVVSFVKSHVIIDHSEEIDVTLRIDTLLDWALSYPKRFSPAYLAEILKNTPWTPEEVLSKSRNNYVIGKAFEDFSDFRFHVFRD